MKNFIELNNIPIQAIYKNSHNEGWSRLCQRAGKIEDFYNKNETEIFKTIKNKWLSTSSNCYFSFLLKIAKWKFVFNLNELSDNEKSMLLMLHYDVWQNAGGFKSLDESIKEIGKNNILLAEIIQVLEILIDNIAFNELDIELPYSQPLKLHARYTRDQILAAFRLSTFKKKSSNREGVAENAELKSELLFINLIKSEENFSPTTMYDDYAINESLFHWQSQN
ncbi:MAG: DUF3427 domain-containing protein, partial [Ferruginibacter sp.]